APQENRNKEPIRRNVTVETTYTKALVAQDRIGAPQENRNKEPIRRNVTVETTYTKALVAQDRIGYD
nr:hypothetical protein [Tanacetum cinerariifolium]